MGRSMLVLGMVVCAVLVGVAFLSYVAERQRGALPVVLQFVSGTEYNIGEAGQVIVEARYANGSSALQGCNASIWYPGKALFVSQGMVASAAGNQYMNFTVPNETGVYEYQATCALQGSKMGVISRSFHVSEFQNDTFTKLNRVKAVVAK